MFKCGALSNWGNVRNVMLKKLHGFAYCDTWIREILNALHVSVQMQYLTICVV